MWSNAREIAAGDTVIIWLTRDLLQPLVVTPGKDFNSKFGNYRHSDLIGIPFGSKIGSSSGKGYIHVLRPTPELWTMALPHRTQILYLADIAFITSYLGIRRGSRVIEAGTGSGSFSHSVIRTIGTSGHLWSYEFHETRANKAREEFARHGFADNVTLNHRNICKEGFTVTDKADSLFLDIPAPWDAVEHAKKALRKDCVTRICCFSPCMEQVLRTVSALNDAGFTEITMYETLLRPHEVSQLPALQPINEVSEKLKKAEQVREEKRLRQIASGKGKSSDGHGAKRKRDGETDQEPLENDITIAGKRVKTHDSDPAPEDEAEAHANAQDLDVSQSAPESSHLTIPVVGNPTSATKINVSKAMPEVRGHTSYLTFACLLPPITGISDITSSIAVDVPQ